MLTCEECGIEFARRRYGSPARYCAPRCRARAAQRRERADGRHARRLEALRATRILKPQIEQTCPHCHGTFTSARLLASCGKAPCRRADKAHRMRESGAWRPHAARARAIRRGAPADTAEVFHPDEIFERDGWICGICDEPVNPVLKWPDQDSATLDHIERVQQSGPHTRANTRCAHARCNRQRG